MNIPSIFIKPCRLILKPKTIFPNHQRTTELKYKGSINCSVSLKRRRRKKDSKMIFLKNS